MHVHDMHGICSYGFGLLHTFLNISLVTRRAQKARMYRFLFSRLVLSICMYRFSGPRCLLQSTNVFTNNVRVKLLSCGNCRVSTNANASFPCGVLVCTMTPVTWVRRRHKLLVDLAMCLVFGRFVLAWSMPSIITHMFWSGEDRAFNRCLWYFCLSLLKLFIHAWTQEIISRNTYATYLIILWGHTYIVTEL